MLHACRSSKENRQTCSSTVHTLRRGKSVSNDQTAPSERVLDFLRLLWEVDHALQVASRRSLVRHGVTGPQRLAVRLMAQHPGIGAGDLARFLHLHPSTMTGILSRLEARNLIRRMYDPIDGRRLRFRLSPAGERIAQLTEGTVESHARHVLESHSNEELEAVQRVLRALCKEMTSQTGSRSTVKSNVPRSLRRRKTSPSRRSSGSAARRR
jgi:DNA-binding MarR family transcriptional regulator